MTTIPQADLVARLDTYFNVGAFDEQDSQKLFPAGYDSIFERFAAPGFRAGTWNGLMLNNTDVVQQVYTLVFPSPETLDMITAREVQRGDPGALIFCHHLTDYRENAPGLSVISEAQLEELHEHCISFYLCHAPLDCHPEISTSGALAAALKLREPARFASYRGGLAGVYGTLSPIGFNELCKRAAEVTQLPALRYSAIRNNGRTVARVGVIGGEVSDLAFLREALTLDLDTIITGEWWLFGPGETRATRRAQMHEVLIGADLNLIGTSHYASEAVVMREPMLDWFRANAPGVEARFVAQDDPLR